MKRSDFFKAAIQKHLEVKAEQDELFAVKFKNDKKNIEDCCTYILNTVQKSGINGFTDAEVYSMAVHYYDEEIIDIGKAIDATVVVNHTVELTQEEKDKARKEAIQKVQDDAMASMRKKQAPTIIPAKKEVAKTEELSLF